MRAAVCRGPEEALVIEDLDLRAPESREVRVRLQASGICHSDVHLIQGEWGDLDKPVVAGHEGVGIVDAVGELATRAVAGDRVIVSLIASCGTCRACARGWLHLCQGRPKYAPRLRRPNGDEVACGFDSATFAEATVVHESQVVPIGDAVPHDCAGLLACAVITGVGSVWNSARVKPGESVVVIGAGGVGLNAVQGAALVGAETVVAVDLVEGKLTAAREFGATHVVDGSGDGDTVEAVRDITDGADHVLVTVGSRAAILQGLDMLGPRGTLAAVGIPPRDEAELPLTMRSAFGGERRLMGVGMGSTNLMVDVPRLIHLYEQGRLKLDELVTQTYPLEGINDGIAAMMDGRALRNVLVY
ncbi:zinc-binding dehydrogenase [Candidatus Poribacteria bacterium]|nr:zinc-binding dehydrogenase [Candidatus Poribacteria bacterium]